MSPAPTSSNAEPRVAVAADGSLIAHVEPDRIQLLEPSKLEVVAEIGIDPEAEGSDVLLCGDPVRLVVLSRYPSGGRLHAIDPRGPTAVGELAIRGPQRMVATSGNHVWLTSSTSASVVNVAKRELVLTPLPLRAPTSAVGPFVDGRFVASTGGVIEEWDVENRTPARRFRLAKPMSARFVGGGGRQVWMVPADADRIEIIPLVNIGQPARIDLPEAPLRIAADAASETLVVIGAVTGNLHIIDLSGKTPPTVLEGVTGTDVAWLGTTASVVVAGVGVEIVPVSGRPRLTVGATGGNPPVEPEAAAVAPASERPAPIRPERARMLTPAPIAQAPRLTVAAAGTDGETAPRGWRDDLASWARTLMAGTDRDAPSIDEGPAVTVAERLGLGGDLADALWLVYGAHLNGVDGVSAMDLVAVIGRHWPEVLGRGRLASSGALRWRKSRIRLCPEVRAALDERPLAGGALIESAAEQPEAAVAVVAVAPTDLAPLASAMAPRIGSLLVADPRDPRPIARRIVEARVRGALPVLRWPAAELTGPPPRALLVVADDSIARALGVPIIGTWPSR